MFQTTNQQFTWPNANATRVFGRPAEERGAVYRYTHFFRRVGLHGGTPESTSGKRTTIMPQSSVERMASTIEIGKCGAWKFPQSQDFACQGFQGRSTLHCTRTVLEGLGTLWNLRTSLWMYGILAKCFVWGTRHTSDSSIQYWCQLISKFYRNK